MFITLLIILTTYLMVMLGSDNHGDNGLPPTQPGLPHNWPNTVNPRWGSTWGGNWGSGNWGTSSSSGSNMTVGAPRLPQHIQPPMWPGQFYSQHPNAGPPGFYPLNWGGYAYPLAPNQNEPLTDKTTVPKTAQAEPQVSKSKGKKKASDDKLLQIAKEEEDYQVKAKQHDVEDEPIPPEVLAIARRIHGQDWVGELEQRLKHAHESLATALQRTQQLKQELAQANKDKSSPQLKDDPWHLSLQRTARRIDGAAYLRDSRVHNGTIHKGSSVDEWISFLTGSMGIKPTHPDEPQPASTDTGESGSECSDEDEDDDDEPWHVKWHRANLLPKNTPDYKQHEHSIFLKVEQEKFDRQRNDCRIHEYNTALAQWEAQPGRRPPSLPSAVIGGNPERDNGFWGMIGPRFIYLHKYNIILANTEVANTVFPMSIQEMHGMVIDIRNHQPHWQNDLYLLGKFYRISLSVQLKYWDLSMQTAITRFNAEWEDIHRQFESLDPPKFIPLPATYYSIWIVEMNVACPQALVEISSSTNVLEHMEWDGSRWDMDEDDVIHHMAHNGLTQPMVDSAYPYGLTFIDCGLSTDSAHAEFYVEIDQRQHVLLNTYGMPPTIDTHQGWWYLDVQDLERIRVLCHIQSYESTDKRTSNSGMTSTRPIYDWFHVGEHYVYEWLAERPPPSDAYHTKPMTGSPLLPPRGYQNRSPAHRVGTFVQKINQKVVASLDEDVEMDNRVRVNLSPTEASSAPSGSLARQDGDAAEPVSDAAGSLDTDITRLLIVINTGGTAPAVNDVPATKVVSDEEMPAQTH
ncbi:hypothetical protein IW262DRAFT_1300215 [Armillaria fumosa]|nr:hypothetical protein IW262DRAFT_1300215 [Armillaria fumosa]